MKPRMDRWDNYELWYRPRRSRSLPTGDPEPIWPKVEKAAGIITAVAGAVGGVAVAAKAVVEYLEAQKTAKQAEKSHDESKSE